MAGFAVRRIGKEAARVEEGGRWGGGVEGGGANRNIYNLNHWTLKRYFVIKPDIFENQLKIE